MTTDYKYRETMPNFQGAERNNGRYNGAHQRERKRWKPIVEAGNAYCQQGLNGSSGTCLHRTRWIKPGTPWALGHDDTGTTWIGPVHADCNQRDGARRGALVANANRKGRRTPRPWRSRNWNL